MLARLAQSPIATPLRALVNLGLGSTPRRVIVRGGAARGARLELNLRREKAYWLAHYEPPLQRFFADTVAADDVVYDVGAHIGFFTVLAGRLGARVFAFEPVPASVERLRTNVELNDIDGTVVPAAAWRDGGGVALHFGPTFEQARVDGSGPAPSVSLDDFASTHPAPTVLKIDAEGAEGEILRGAARLLRDGRPLTIVCELHGSDARADVLAQLAGFDVEELGANGG